MTNQLADGLASAGMPLTFDQNQQLAQIIMMNREGRSAGQPIAADPLLGATTEAAASAVLSPDQLNAFKQLLALQQIEQQVQDTMQKVRKQINQENSQALENAAAPAP